MSQYNTPNVRIRIEQMSLRSVTDRIQPRPVKLFLNPSYERATHVD